MNQGEKIEIEFVNEFNNKRINELNKCCREFILDIFEEVDKDELIICWKDRNKQKSDIFIKIGKYTKGISIKSGNNNSMHAEPIEKFKLFLENINIPYKMIEVYRKYHFGVKYEDGINIGKYSAKEYQEIHKDELNELNKHLNKTKNIINMVDRFIIKNPESKYDISALITGTPKKFVWLKKDDIYDFVLSFKNEKHNGPHVGNLFIQPKKRDLNNNEYKDKDIFQVQVKTFDLSDQIKAWKKKQKKGTLF